MEFDYFGLIDALGIKKGDKVDIVSDLRTIMLDCREKKIRFQPDVFLNTFCDVVGPEGTILVRTFSWDFCHGKGFDIKNTGSQVGALGNVALKNPRFKRTRHPLYSWMVYGVDTEQLIQMNNKEAFSRDSVFGWEDKENILLVRIGNPEAHGFTIFHYIEELVGVPYRYIKEFSGNYIDENGKCEQRTYSMYVRNLKMSVETNTYAYEPIFEKQGVVCKTDFSDIFLEKYELNRACRIMEQDVRYNGSKLSVSYKDLF